MLESASRDALVSERDSGAGVLLSERRAPHKADDTRKAARRHDCAVIRIHLNQFRRVSELHGLSLIHI